MKTAENQPLLDYREHITQRTHMPRASFRARALPEAISCIGDELYFISWPQRANATSKPLRRGICYRQAGEARSAGLSPVNYLPSGT
ncbi:hypothetical protein LNP05_29565 [Klebsiella pneumoniae subsp. pneumoniae]|nr:hypothetical protein [Klebsiella pneumoniae subsp. pneumoniae]